MVASATSRYAEWRQAPARLVGVVALALAAAVFLWQLPHFLAGNSTVWPQYASAFTDMLTYTAWGAAVLLALTALTRTVSLRQLLAFWFLGVFAVHGLILAIELPFRASMGTNEMGIWVAPVIETLVVLLVIVAFYALATYRQATRPTVSDGLLIGFATGAGVGFHEEMTYARLVPIGPGAEYSSASRTGQDIWWSYVFPMIGWQGSFNIRQFGNGVVGNFTLYHAGWATLVGIGVGLVFVHRHRALAWLAGALAVAVTYFDHMGGNFSALRSSETPPVIGSLFHGGDVMGVSEVAVYFLLFAIVGAIAVDLLVFRRTAGWIEGLPPARSALKSRYGDHPGVRASSVGGPSGLRGLQRAVGLDAYARHRRAAMVGLYRHAASGREASALVAALSRLHESGRRLGFVAGLGLVAGVVLAGVVGSALGGVAVAIDSLACVGCAPQSGYLEFVVSAIGGVVTATAAGGLALGYGLPPSSRFANAEHDTTNITYQLSVSQETGALLVNDGTRHDSGKESEMPHSPDASVSDFQESLTEKPTLLAYNAGGEKNMSSNNPYAFSNQTREEKARIRELAERAKEDLVFYANLSQEDQWKIGEYRKWGYGEGLPAVKDTAGATGKVGVEYIGGIAKGKAGRKVPWWGFIQTLKEWVQEVGKAIDKHNEGKSKTKNKR